MGGIFMQGNLDKQEESNQNERLRDLASRALKLEKPLGAILGFLELKDILQLSSSNKAIREMSKKTIPSPSGKIRESATLEEYLKLINSERSKNCLKSIKDTKKVPDCQLLPLKKL